MMKHFLAFAFLSLLVIGECFAQKIPTIYIDHKGVMRWSDTRKEASFYGVNYTLPFAHAYRAMNYLGIDHKSAIDRDVYHLARLGFNAYRIHLWDVEISDGEGNLKENEHLQLLDYLFMRLRERGIRIVITAQTNFGNGYPERNIPTGGYSYDYDKCDVHQNSKAIAAQEKYLAALVNHINPHTGLAYKDDPYIVGFEINNEPCHPGTKAETKAYIDCMLAALKKAGNKKPVFYNVSHNQAVVEAYYDTAIQGTTYQWYPIGLVSGHTRKGNFLPCVDSYDISFSDVKGFANKARLVYEFDPADIMYSYMYPAVARTFRTAGFQWITQFAYDPIDMAYANTEYQTHFLNLAYTPGKAISMKIAAEVARNVTRGESFGTYPNDTLFHDVRVSYPQDLSELNRPDAFFYSNTTETHPVAAEQLQSIAGCGSSPIVKYEGTGAYFIDKLEDGIWRLEVMPDAVQVNDPFAKPSLKKEVVAVLKGAWDLTLNLPDLGNQFNATGLNDGNTRTLETTNGTLPQIDPGVYLLKRKHFPSAKEWNKDTRWQNIRLGEYVMPEMKPRKEFIVVNHPAKVAEAGKDLLIETQIIGPEQPDSVIIYTDKISFWNATNPYIKMKHTQGYTYQAVILGTEVKEKVFRYNVVVCRNGKQQTFPGSIEGSPLDWDYTGNLYWETEVAVPESAVTLVAPSCENRNETEHYTLPEGSDHHFLKKYIREEVKNRTKRLSQATHLCLRIKGDSKELKAGFITSDGYTYKADCPAAENGIIRIPLHELQQTATALLPHAYPVFLKEYFEPKTAIPFCATKIETLEVSGNGRQLSLESAWIE